MLPKLRNKRGFTLVELMIVVAIIGVLAALAIFGVKRYMSSAKSSEATNALGRITKNVAMKYDAESLAGTVQADGSSSTASSALCPDAPAVPAAVPKGTKVQATNAAWDTVWRPCLKFEMQGPQYYQYIFDYKGSDPTVPANNDAFSAIAYGDLDADGTLSTFQYDGLVQIDTTGGRVKLADAIKQTLPEE